MQVAMMMAMQAAQVAGPPLPVEMRPIRPTPVATPCGEADASGDIVVCGRATASDRLPKIAGDRYAERPIRARTTIGGVGVSAEAEQATLPNGQSAPRAMLKLKLPF